METYLKTLLSSGVERAEKAYPFEDGNDSREDPFWNAVSQYVAMVREAYFHNKALATGDLSAEISSRNMISMPSKALQSNLRHLVWQTKRIKDGDLNQRIDFLGDFSSAFNALIEGLKQKRALERQVAENENRLRTITSVLGDGLIVTDREAHITFCNPEACAMLKFSPRELLGSGFHEKAHFQQSDGRKISDSGKFVFRTIKGKTLYRSEEMSFTRSDGQLFPVSVSCSPLREGEVCSGAVIAFRDITEQKKYQESLEYINKILKRQTTTDNLTGLFNRQYFNEALSKEVNKASRHNTLFSLIIFDIDKFKDINDTFGHLAGDNVLKEIAVVVGDSLRKYDVLARWGGEEFVILVPETGIQSAVDLAERTRKNVAGFDFTIERKVTCSFGVTEYRMGEDPVELVNRADEALYQAKETGRNKVVAR